MLLETHFDKRFTRKNYVRDLLPVIKKGDSFDLETASETIKLYIDELTNYDSGELIFIKSIDSKRLKFDSLFHDKDIIEKAEKHPLTFWRITRKE